MATAMTSQTVHKTIQVYFLAAPEDQSVCEDIIKHLKPIMRTSPIPIEVNSDFNIPAGMEKEKHQSRLFEADIVLALISVDFIDNDDIYNRNQKVIERHNNHQTVMIPILVRNFMWKATPFVSLPVVPKNLQPLNNRQFWNSPDDAVMAVVSDIYDSINELAQRQRAVLEPFAAETGKRTADVQDTSGSAVRQPAPDSPMTPAPPMQSEALQPLPAAEVEPAQAPTAPVETSTGQMESSMKEAPAMPGGAVQPTPAVEEKPALDLKAAPVGAIPPATATSQSRAPSQIAVDWRKKYYTTVVLKRAGAILLDHILLYLVLIIILLPFADSPDEVFSSAMGWGFFILYFVIMPLMESSKWQGTIGKRILKLQITDREGERITFLRAFWRNVMRSLVLYSYFFVLPLILQYFRFQKTRKLFHDELSGTVIGERLTGSAAVRDATGVAGSAG